LIDYHLHLVDHGESRVFGTEDVRAYARAGAAAGLTEIAITEHLYRFPDVQDAFGDWWANDPDPALVANTLREVEDERLEQSLADYVDIVSAAASEPVDGCRVLMGLEVDLVPGRMAEVVELLAPYDWDVLLGAVHWIGAWGYDNTSDPVQAAEWARRDSDEAWLAYTAAIEEMAASGACDVLAHLDKIKIAGVWPEHAARECEERLVKAATSNGLAIELNTNGLRKSISQLYPSPQLLAAMHAAGVGLTFASDAHTADRIGGGFDEALASARAAGYTELMRFEKRRAIAVPLPSAEAD